MAETNEQTQAPAEKTPSELLDNLINVLVHRTYHAPEWLDAIEERITDPERAREKLGKMITLAAQVGVEEAVTRKMMALIVESDQLALSNEKIDSLVSVIYQDRRRVEEIDRRSRAGLPPLEA